MEMVKIFDYTGDFAENKDAAKKIRVNILMPALANGKAITFDFAGIVGATQSFVHALISDAMRKYPNSFYNCVFYRNTNKEIQQIITIVYRYMQESLSE